MGKNLKARLERIRDMGGNTPLSGGTAGKSPDAGISSLSGTAGSGENPFSEWTEAGFKTLKRKLYRQLPFHTSPAFPEALAILVPDILRLGRIPLPEEFLFFDLETTGLSGGAGTVAFLAAFGRFCTRNETKESDNVHIEITQYLLLDYPGESDFIEMTVKEFTGSPLPVVVSYNGKCFDSQILKNRCLMNGIMNPGYDHADLLHPARRLWKRMIPDCSQSTIEVSVLGLDRTGDVGGAEAPLIWFSFLRNGETRELLSICDHNVKDIAGLASLFLTLGEIADEPLESRNKFRFDEEELALSWVKTVNKNLSYFGKEERRKGELLLESAANKGYSRAAGSMAIKAEWYLKDPALALEYTISALANPEITERQREEFEKRRARLERKLKRRQ